MRSTIILTIVLIIVQNSVAPPVTNDEEKKDDETFKDFEEHDWEADPRGPPPKVCNLFIYLSTYAYRQYTSKRIYKIK